MFCSKCGSENPEVARFCAKCGAPMPPPAAAATAAAAPPVVDTMRGLAPTSSPSSTTPAGAAVVSVTGKTPWVAALLSFFITGLGQLYNGDFKKGAVMFGLAVLGFIFTGGLLTVGVWIWGMVDGWQVAAGKFKPW